MVTSLTKHNIKSVVEENKQPVIVDVYATWCGPCMQMKPHFEKLADELHDKYTFASLNIDEARELAIKYSVTSVPTFLFIQHNNVVAREVGYMPVQELRKRIEEYLG